MIFKETQQQTPSIELSDTEISINQTKVLFADIKRLDFNAPINMTLFIVSLALSNLFFIGWFLGTTEYPASLIVILLFTLPLTLYDIYKNRKWTCVTIEENSPFGKKTHTLLVTRNRKEAHALIKNIRKILLTKGFDVPVNKMSQWLEKE